jgi:hypothetical protein
MRDQSKQSQMLHLWLDILFLNHFSSPPGFIILTQDRRNAILVRYYYPGRPAARLPFAGAGDSVRVSFM